MEPTTLEEYKATVMQRFNSLADGEKNALLSLRGTPEGIALIKILGEEMEEIITMVDSSVTASPVIKRGLATR
jgi:hypothetical protein|tara:strand:- start:221 stop:439 length:219 start_codon:yes stop_codon:yes gene_type:complete